MGFEYCNFAYIHPYFRFGMLRKGKSSMAFTYQIFDAAHKYGLDNQDVNSTYSSANSKKIGDPVSAIQGWAGDEPPVGQPVSATVVMSGGYNIAVDFVLTSQTSGVITDTSLLRAGTNEKIYSITGNIEITSATMPSVAMGSSLFSGDDLIVGNAFNNALRGYGGNDRIDGQAGTDTVHFASYSTGNKIARNGADITVSGTEGTDTLVNVERLRFIDKVIAFDTEGAAGQAYRLYQAAFNRKPDSSGLAFHVNSLDGGAALTAIAQNFINSPEFVKTYGSLDNTKFVTQLYANVLHRAPDTPGLAYHVGTLDRAELGRAQVLVGFSESPENKAALIGVIQDGISFATDFT